MPVELDSNRKLLCAVAILFLAIIFQIVIVYYVQEDVDHDDRISLSLSADAISAIKRSRSIQCKEELEQYALEHQNERPIFLERSCPRDDSHVERVIKLGCPVHGKSIDSSSSTLFAKIQEQIESSSECTELCFSHDHSHAGYDGVNQECWCADDLELPRGLQFAKSSLKKCNLEWYRVNNGIYRIERQTSQNSTGLKRQIRIIFLLSLNGRSIDQIQRLFKAIYSKTHYYYFHVDSRQQYLQGELERLYEGAGDNIIFAKRRYETVWGGPSLLAMLIEAMDQVAHLEWDYIINLSETDFPIKKLERLEDYLGTHDLESIYLKSHNMKGHNFIKKQGLGYSFYQCEGRVWRLGKRHLPRGIIYSGGSDWIGLPKEFCDFILTQKSQANSLVNSLLNIYNFTLLPAESFFHTLAINSKFCDKSVDNNLRLTNWHRKQGCKCQHKQVVDWCGCSPLVYRFPDWPRLEQTKSSESIFFSRKFDPTISATIIGHVENLLSDNQTESLKDIDSRYWLNSYAPPDQVESGANQLCQYSREKIRMKVALQAESTLRSIDLYFNKDQYVGIICRYCQQDDSSCIQLLVQQKPDQNPRRLNHGCLKAEDRLLLSLKVSHGFDTGERMFRNFLPLSTSSEIVVHHEWSVVQREENPEAAGKILFKWIDPDERVELIQEIKLKTTHRPSRLSLVHKLVHERPLTPGLWHLIVQDEHEDCMEYRFLIIGDGAPQEQVVSSRRDLASFDELHEILDFCFDYNKSPAIVQSQRDCRNHEWSLVSRDKIREAHKLTTHDKLY